MNVARSTKSAILVAAIGCLVVSGIALARAGSIETKVKAGWENDNHKVSGYLDTERTPEGFECAQGRKIVVKYLDKNERVGSGKTKSGGEFPGSFEIGLGGFAPKGTYKVIAKKKEVNSIACEKGSKTLKQPFDEND